MSEPLPARPNARRPALSRHKLSDQHKIYVVNRLAAFDALAAIQRGLEDAFGIAISRPALVHYNPERAGSRRPAQRWTELFAREREAYIARIAGLGNTGKPARIRRRQAMVHAALAAGEHRLANAILTSITKELGPAVSR